VPVTELPQVFSPSFHLMARVADRGQETLAGTADSLFPRLLRRAGCATARGGDTWYMVGGYRTCFSDPTIIDVSSRYSLGPMISYDSATGVWIDDSAASFLAAGSALWSRMHNVPFGSSNGLNDIFGGGVASSPTQDTSSLLSFDRIDIYDPSASKIKQTRAT